MAMASTELAITGMRGYDMAAVANSSPRTLPYPKSQTTSALSVVECAMCVQTLTETHKGACETSRLVIRMERGIALWHVFGAT